jgi:hypothetical protein
LVLLIQATPLSSSSTKDKGTAVIISVPFLENLLPKAVVEHFHYARQCSIIQARTSSLRAIATLALGGPRRPQR